MNYEFFCFLQSKDFAFKFDGSENFRRTDDIRYRIIYKFGEKEA